MLNPDRLVECPRCQGNGETAVPGTYGGTISPENLETVQCSLCEGQGELTAAALADYDRHVAEVADGEWI